MNCSGCGKEFVPDFHQWPRGPLCKDCWEVFVGNIPKKSKSICTLCSAETNVVVNINFKAVRVCNSCCLTITKQTVSSLKSLEGVEP